MILDIQKEYSGFVDSKDFIAILCTELKNARRYIKVSVGIYTHNSGHSSQNIFIVLKVDKVIIRKFRDTQFNKHSQAK